MASNHAIKWHGYKKELMDKTTKLYLYNTRVQWIKNIWQGIDTSFKDRDVSFINTL